MNTITSTQAQMDGFISADLDKPVCMVNLLKFKPEATYADDAPEAGDNATGAEAYDRYWNGVVDVLAAIGAKPILYANAEFYMVGEGDWDRVAIVWYPSRQICLEMGAREDYQALIYHREAGLLNTELIVTMPGEL